MSRPEIGTCLARIPAQKLVRLTGALDGAEPWCDGGVRREHVDAALRENRLSDVNPRWKNPLSVDDTPEMHAERIAWLVVHGWDPEEPLDIEVKASSALYVHDGNHRLHALAYLGDDRPVLISIYGFLGVAEELFGIEISGEGVSA